MIIWLSGEKQMGCWDFAIDRNTSILKSYFYIQSNRNHEFYGIMKRAKQQRVPLFLDSGAFSAFTKNAKVNIYAYIDFIYEHLDLIDVYANLDSIGNAKQTLKNQRIMEEHGLSPLPCFHHGCDYRYLKYYVDNYEYIALGGVAQLGKNKKRLLTWLDRCWSIICDEQGYPKCKVHGFAITSTEIMLRYPWWSVDSTSWIMIGRNGGIYVPHYRGHKWVYSKKPMVVSVSHRSPTMITAGEHYTTLSPIRQKQVETYIAEKGYKMGHSIFKEVKPNHTLKKNQRWVIKGKTIEIIKERGLSNCYKQRDELNILFFLDLEKSWPKWPLRWNRPVTLQGLNI